MRWFTSDMHFGHKGILKYRTQFADLDHMHAVLIERWNAVVATDDEVWVVGDVALRDKALPLMDELHGIKHLVAGNHDDCHPASHRSDPAFHLPRYLRHFATVDTGWVDLDGWRMCHFPYFGDHTIDDRFVEHRPPDDGGILLHGHCHTAWRVWGRQFNVGVDVNGFAPVSEDALRDLFPQMEAVRT
jgi:calcineurin-like phosphoesterase family protein